MNGAMLNQIQFKPQQYPLSQQITRSAPWLLILTAMNRAWRYWVSLSQGEAIALRSVYLLEEFNSN